MAADEAKTGVLLTVDRPGPDDHVYVQDEDEREALIPRAWLPGVAREGDVFRLDLQRDDGLARRRRAAVSELIDELQEESSSDGLEEL